MSFESLFGGGDDRNCDAEGTIGVFRFFEFQNFKCDAEGGKFINGARFTESGQAFSAVFWMMRGYARDMQLTDEQIREDARACLESKVRQARRMSMKERFLAGASLFEDACRWTLAGIRNQYPEWNEAECRVELRKRVEMM